MKHYREMSLKAHAYQLAAWLAFVSAGGFNYSLNNTHTVPGWVTRLLIATALMITGIACTEMIYRHGWTDGHKQPHQPTLSLRPHKPTVIAASAPQFAEYCRLVLNIGPEEARCVSVHDKNGLRGLQFAPGDLHVACELDMLTSQMREQIRFATRLKALSVQRP